MLTDAWTVNFEIRLEVQLRTYQPPIPKPSQASAWSYRYSGRWMCKPKVPLVDYNRISASSPIRLGRDFGRLNSRKNPLAKVVDFEPLGALSGPGAPDPDLAHFQIKA